MNQNQGIFYCSPYYMMTIENLQHLEIGIKTKGYEEFVGDNLIISIGIIERLTNGSK